MDILDISIAAKKAKRELEESGQIPYVSYNFGEITWDGLRGIDQPFIPGEVLEVPGELWWVSDITPKPEQISFINVWATTEATMVRNVRFQISEELAVFYGDYDSSSNMLLGIIVYKAAEGIPAGTYLYMNGNNYVNKILGEFIETIHPIDDEFLSKPKNINLCDHGINAWEILAKGNGVHTLTVEGTSLFDEVPPVGTDFILTNVDGANFPVAINNVVVAYSQADSTVPMQVCFTVVGINMSFLIKADIAIVSAGGNTEIYANVSYTTVS